MVQKEANIWALPLQQEAGGTKIFWGWEGRCKKESSCLTLFKIFRPVECTKLWFWWNYSWFYGSSCTARLQQTPQHQPRESHSSLKVDSYTTHLHASGKCPAQSIAVQTSPVLPWYIYSFMRWPTRWAISASCGDGGYCAVATLLKAPNTFHSDHKTAITW